MTSMVNRRWVWLGMIGLASLTLIYVAKHPKKPDMDSTFRKVKVGMTADEVNELVGEFRLWSDSDFSGSLTVYGAEDRLWKNSNKHLTVEFSSPSKDPVTVVSVEIRDYGPDSQTLWSRLRNEYRYWKEEFGDWKWKRGW